MLCAVARVWGTTGVNTRTLAIIAKCAHDSNGNHSHSGGEWVADAATMATMCSALLKGHLVKLVRVSTCSFGTLIDIPKEYGAARHLVDHMRRKGYQLNVAVAGHVHAGMSLRVSVCFLIHCVQPIVRDNLEMTEEQCAAEEHLSVPAVRPLYCSFSSHNRTVLPIVSGNERDSRRVAQWKPVGGTSSLPRSPRVRRSDL